MLPIYVLLTSLYKENERVRDSSLFFLFLSGLQTSELFEMYFPDFDVKISSQCNFVSLPEKLFIVKGTLRTCEQVHFHRLAVPVLWLLLKKNSVHVCSDTSWSDSRCMSMIARAGLFLGFPSAFFSGFVLIVNQLYVTFCGFTSLALLFRRNQDPFH